MKNWKLDRIISIATLVVSVVALILVLKKPAPLAAPQTASQALANAQSFQNKLSQLQSTQPQSNSDTSSSDPSQLNATDQAQQPAGISVRPSTGRQRSGPLKRKLAICSEMRPNRKSTMPPRKNITVEGGRCSQAPPSAIDQM